MASFVENGRPVQATRAKVDFGNFEWKTKARFTNLIENEIASLGVSMKQYLDHYFSKSAPLWIFNKNNEATIEDVFIRFIDEVKGEIQEWSQSESG